MRRMFIAGALLVALLAATQPASATHSWSTYHWRRTSNPFTLKLGDNVTKWDSFLSKASVDWTKSRVLDTRIVPGGTTSATCAPTAGRVEVCASAYGSNGWLGLATIWLNGSHITKGTVKLNNTYFNTSKYDDPNAMQHVMCQEIGHTLGLDHERKVGSQTCMDDVNGLFSSSYIHPNQHDFDMLKYHIYKHLDAASKTSPVRESRTVTIRRTGPDTAVVTHIFWVPSPADAASATW